MQMHQPVMYSPYGSTLLNQRASLLAGKVVHGDALLSFTKIRPNEWRTPCMKWEPFTLAMYRAWLGSALPTAHYASTCSMPLLAALPPAYRYVNNNETQSPIVYILPAW